MRIHLENNLDLSSHPNELLLNCNGGFGYGKGILFYRYRDVEVPYWQFSNNKDVFEASVEFVEEVISDHMQQVNHFILFPDDGR